MCVLLSTLIASSCDYKKYAEGIKKDTQKTFEKNKDYIYQLGFEGQIKKKTYCADCELNKYTLTLELSQLSEKPVINNVQYLPYYTFESDSILNITVSKELYEQVKERDKIYKKKESFNLTVQERELLYLNKEKYRWLP
jgi:hypothetical protein